MSLKYLNQKQNYLVFFSFATHPPENEPLRKSLEIAKQECVNLLAWCSMVLVAEVCHVSYLKGEEVGGTLKPGSKFLGGFFIVFAWLPPSTVPTAQGGDSKELELDDTKLSEIRGHLSVVVSGPSPASSSLYLPTSRKALSSLSRPTATSASTPVHLCAEHSERRARWPALPLLKPNFLPSRLTEVANKEQPVTTFLGRIILSPA